MSLKKKVAFYASLAGVSLASSLGINKAKAETQEPKESSAIEQPYVEEMPTNYLGIPLVGIDTVKYMGSEFTPQRKTENGSIIQADIDTPNPDILTDTKIGTKTTVGNKESGNEKDVSNHSSFEKEIHGASITYNKEKMGSPVYFKVFNHFYNQSSTEKNSSNGDKEEQYNFTEDPNTLVFYIENQEDLDKLQKFCVYNISHFISSESDPLRDRERALRDFGALFDFTAAKDDRLDSLPGKSTRKVFTEEELSAFHKSIKESLKKQVALEQGKNNPSLVPAPSKEPRPLPKDFLPKASRE